MIKKYFSMILLSQFITSMAIAGPVEAYRELTEGKAVFLDVREEEEIKSGMIKGADWIPLSLMEASSTDTLKKVKATAAGKNIYLYCRSGRRSQIFLDNLKRAGLSGENLGGFQDLVKAGLPVK
jgi:rhodanese-related sulfurtransferase